MQYNKKRTYWTHKEEIQLYKVPIDTDRCSLGAKKQLSKTRTKYENMSLRDQIASDKRRKSYYEKRCRYLTDLAIHNRLYTFITLTFKEPITDYRQAQHEWDLFLKRLKYHLKKPIKYLACHELQRKRGRVFHYHALTDIGYIDVKELEKIWGQGFVFIRQIDSLRESSIKQIIYLFKYISKDIMDEEKTGKRNSVRKIYCSRNMKKPTIKKELSTESFEEIVFANMEHIIETGSYEMRNHQNLKINDVDFVKISRKE